MMPAAGGAAAMTPEQPANITQIFQKHGSMDPHINLAMWPTALLVLQADDSS
jgi:hypothetical protein